MPSIHPPVLWRHGPGRTVEVLLEAKFEGLPHSINDTLSQPITTFQDVAGYKPCREREKKRKELLSPGKCAHGSRLYSRSACVLTTSWIPHTQRMHAPECPRGEEDLHPDSGLYMP